MKRILFLLIIFIVVSSCEKEHPEEYYHPSISNISVMPLELYQFIDTLVISFNYEDMDGDIGFEDPNIYALKVKDSRLENPDWFHVQPLSPLGETIPISGTLEIQINSIFLLSTANQESLTYTLSIQDRQGHWSNELVSMPITIMR